MQSGFPEENPFSFVRDCVCGVGGKLMVWMALSDSSHSVGIYPDVLNSLNDEQGTAKQSHCTCCGWRQNPRSRESRHMMEGPTDSSRDQSLSPVWAFALEAPAIPIIFYPIWKAPETPKNTCVRRNWPFCKFLLRTYINKTHIFDHIQSLQRAYEVNALLSLCGRLMILMDPILCSSLCPCPWPCDLAALHLKWHILLPFCSEFSHATRCGQGVTSMTHVEVWEKCYLHFEKCD